MDPFTQRMLERAKARREKLDTQLSNAGHDIKKYRSPLKDANAILRQATAENRKSPTKSLNGTSGEIVPTAKSPRKLYNESNNQLNNENEKAHLHSVKSKLQRLGDLYADDSSRELSSPIHRNEECFKADEDSFENKPVKRGTRLGRLAALASTINNWEDDLSHPVVIKQTTSKAEKIQAKFNEQVKIASDPQPSTSGYNSKHKNEQICKLMSPTTQSRWDKSVKERSAIPHNETKQIVKSNVHEPRNKNFSENNNLPMTTLKYNDPGQSTIVEKSTKWVNPSANSSRATSRHGADGTAKSPIQTSGSVLSKASMFESRNADIKTKDPAQMTLSERLALFERNKGQAPLIPKAPLTMSVPPKMLREKEKLNLMPDSSVLTGYSNKTVCTQRAIFEQGGNVQELENDILRNTHIERQREMEILKSRFNKNKEVVQAAAGSCIRTSESSEGKSNSPKNYPICPVKPTPAPDQLTPPPPPPPLPTYNCDNGATYKDSATKRQGGYSQKVPQTVDTDVKRIRVSLSKPERLYPNLSEIENTGTETDTEYTVDNTEAETATLEENTETEKSTEADYNEEESDVCSNAESADMNTSLGRSILRVVNEQALVQNKKRSIDIGSDTSTSDISILDEMDEYLDECLAAQEPCNKKLLKQEGPTPPKLNKGDQNSSTISSSFKCIHESYRSPVKAISCTTPQKKKIYVVEGGKEIPLVHSISFYRRQQAQDPKIPVRLVSRKPDFENSDSDTTKYTDKEETTLVQDKVKRLLAEVSKHQTIIGQASQALNLCNSTVEFSGSREQVEGERLLLVATHRRQAALNEVQRLKVEGTLRPANPGTPEVQESGSLVISAITLPLKRDYFRTMDTNTCVHFVCLVRHLEEIVATPVAVAESGDHCIRFPSTLKLQNLYSDFILTIEVYTLQTQAEMLPHEIKYHIHSISNASGANISNINKKSSGKTPKKLLKQESRLIMPNVQSPAGPSAVRSSAFSLSGYVVFSLKEVHRQQFTLNKVPRETPLEGRLQMHVSCELSVSVEHRGFLTMFEDVSGFGAWHRRWCLLKGTTLSYWKYPDDERKKTPMDSLDLQAVITKNVGLVSRDICARPHTFLFETVRPATSDDIDSLIMVKNGPLTTIRHLLSADTKEDRLEWCSKLNKTLNLIHTWGVGSSMS